MDFKMFGAAGLAAVVLCGCNPAKTDEVAGASPAAGAAAPVAVDPAAEAFVRGLYTGEGEGGGDIDAASPIWSAGTAALLARTEALTQEGDMGFFEADPICDCQDGTAKIVDLTTTMIGPDQADVAVTFNFDPEAPTLLHKVYNLVREGGRWRIDDIHRDKIDGIAQDPLVQSLNVWIADALAHPAT